jgi:hypothetical protein
MLMEQQALDRPLAGPAWPLQMTMSLRYRYIDFWVQSGGVQTSMAATLPFPDERQQGFVQRAESAVKTQFTNVKI